MNHYEVLDVSERASRSEIRAAYLQRVDEAHPDRHVGEADFRAWHERFIRIHEAYEVLYDDATRARYDRTRLLPGRRRQVRPVVTPVHRRTVSSPQPPVPKRPFRWSGMVLAGTTFALAVALAFGFAYDLAQSRQPVASDRWAVSQLEQGGTQAAVQRAEPTPIAIEVPQGQTEDADHEIVDHEDADHEDADHEDADHEVVRPRQTWTLGTIEQASFREVDRRLPPVPAEGLPFQIDENPRPELTAHERPHHLALDALLLAGSERSVNRGLADVRLEGGVESPQGAVRAKPVVDDGRRAALGDGGLRTPPWQLGSQAAVDVRKRNQKRTAPSRGPQPRRGWFYNSLFTPANPSPGGGTPFGMTDPRVGAPTLHRGGASTATASAQVAYPGETALGSRFSSSPAAATTGVQSRLESNHIVPPLVPLAEPLRLRETPSRPAWSP